MRITSQPWQRGTQKLSVLASLLGTLGVCSILVGSLPFLCVCAADWREEHELMGVGG